MSDIKWSAEQIEAITEKGHILVSAGAGSRKNSSINRKINTNSFRRWNRC